MSSSLLVFYIYILFILAAVIFLTLLFFRKRFLLQGLISRSLNLALILVRFPTAAPQENLGLQQLREKIALMEQFYVSLANLRDKWWRALFYGKPSFALELTIPSVGEEISFYIAVPKKLSPSVQKIIQGIFPDAYVEEARDYNIFNPEGETAASKVILKENNYYPIRTYQKLEGDPIKELTGVFTKLAKAGEGAALQIVARPAGNKWRKKLKEHASLLYRGKKPKESLFLQGILALGELTITSSDKKTDKLEEPKKLTPLDEEIVRTIEGKSSKALFETNIRLVASAPTRDRAEDILAGLEAAFSQFTDLNLNKFKIERVRGRNLKNEIFSFSFRSFNPPTAMILSSEELTSLFHFPNVPVETPKIKILKAREAAPPANLPMEGILIGYNQFRGEKTEIRLLEDDRRRHLYVIGQTGTGKTVFLKNLILQDIEEGRGVCFIDPHGETVEEILSLIPRHRSQDVIYFNPGDIERPLGLNMLEYNPAFPEQKTFIVNELFGIFQKLYGAVPEALGPIFEQYFRNSTLLVMEDPASGNTLLEVERVFTDKDFRDLKISKAQNPIVKNFWTQIAEKATGEQSLQNYSSYITSKFDIFLANEIMRPIIAQEKSAFNFREVMDNGKILLVNLSKGRLGDINSALIGLIIVGKLTMSALARADIEEPEKRRDFYLYIDEFQNFTTDSIATILAEARKYRLNLSMAHQYIGQLTDTIKKAVFGNVGSFASFRIGSDDGEFMEKQFAPVFKAQDLINIDNFNCYVKLLMRGETSPPFSLKTYPPVKGDRGVAETIKEISRTKYGRPREEVEEEIRKRFK